VGFSLAILLMYILRQVVKNKSIFKEPNTTAPPPFWIRAILLITCTGVSFSHGSNDGQKGVGLVMLILIAIVPGYFAIDGTKDISDYKHNIKEIQSIVAQVDQTRLHKSDSFEFAKFGSLVASLDKRLNYATQFEYLTDKEKYAIRKDVIQINKASKKMLESADLSLSSNDKKKLKSKVEELKSVTDYAPSWVIMMIAIALGLGTMVGWKRIVKTIGEKIGKQHLTYAQGASSELVAAGTIGLSTFFGLPVSTTQVLSSGIAGSMVASKGVKNLQPATIKSIAIAWILTLPVTVILSGALFLLFRMIL
jgi:PiT family inorganic phosphate transporter